MKFLPIFNAICLAFTIQLKQTHTGVEKRSKTITLPGTFPDLSLQKGDKVAFNAETQDEFEQLILAINDNAGDSHSFHLKSQVVLVPILIGSIKITRWKLRLYRVCCDGRRKEVLRGGKG